MLGDRLSIIGIAAFVLIALELWRRALRGRAPRWIHVLAILLSIEIVVGVVYAEYQLRQALHDVQSEEAANKATVLATGISQAMNSNAIAVSGVLLDVVVLAIGSIIARRTRRDRRLPVANVR